MARIGIIGGGPSGMMAAYAASISGENNVVLVEKNEKLGKKLFITGKGRCNVTNGRDISEFFEHIVSNREFLYSAFYTFTNENLLDLLYSVGLKTKVERGERVFPVSDKSSDVIKTLEKLLKKGNVDIRLYSNVKEIYKEKNLFKVQCTNEEFTFDKLLIATGGLSYSSTGSTGDGYIFAKKFGHSIVEQKPGLCPIKIKNEFIKDLAGLSLKNVSIVFKSGKKTLAKEFGEMLFTHEGISGPIVLSSSSKIDGDCEIYLDLKPALDLNKLDRRILRDFDENKNKSIGNTLSLLLPKKLIPVVLSIAEIDSQIPINQVSTSMRNKLASTIKKLPLKYGGLYPIETGIITRGGVNVTEVDPSTMESKIVENLYFSGEVLDLDAVTGGYNLQIAFSTGYLAGIGM